MPQKNPSSGITRNPPPTPNSPPSRPAAKKTISGEIRLLAGLLVDARGERLTPSHAVKKGRRYRYYVSAALISDAGTDREGWRLAAREIEEAVIGSWPTR